LSEERLWIWCIRKVIDALPPGNRVVVNRVCAMFRSITQFENDNKMNAKNIALVMNPSMFRDKECSVSEFVKNGGMRVRLVENLITHHEDLFVTPLDELDKRAPNFDELSPLVKEQLRKFSETLRENAIVLAAALICEGETELAVTFDHDFAFKTSRDSKLETKGDSKNNSTERQSKYPIPILSKSKSSSQILPKLGKQNTKLFVIADEDGEEEDENVDEDSAEQILRFRSNSFSGSESVGNNKTSADADPSEIPSPKKVITLKIPEEAEVLEPLISPKLRTSHKRRPKQKQKRHLSSSGHPLPKPSPIVIGAYLQKSGMILLTQNQSGDLNTSTESFDSPMNPKENPQDPTPEPLGVENNNPTLEPMERLVSGSTEDDVDHGFVPSNEGETLPVESISSEDILRLFVAVESGNPQIVDNYFESLPIENRTGLAAKLKSISLEMLSLVEKHQVPS